MNLRQGGLTATDFDETSDRRAAFEMADACENAGIHDDWKHPAFWAACNCRLGRDPCNCTRRESGTPYDWTLLLIAAGAVAGIAMGVLS